MTFFWRQNIVIMVNVQKFRISIFTTNICKPCRPDQTALPETVQSEFTVFTIPKIFCKTNTQKNEFSPKNGIKCSQFSDIYLILLLILAKISFYFSYKKYAVGTHSKCLTEALLMSTHNICFYGEIRKLLTWYPSYLVLCLPYYFFCECMFWDLSKMILMRSQNKCFHLKILRISLGSCLSLIIVQDHHSAAKYGIDHPCIQNIYVSLICPKAGEIII